jgi:hypothetical protein
VCIEKQAKYKTWTRNPEKFGRRCEIAKDAIENPIRVGTLVAYDRPLGKDSSSTEQSFGKVEVIWKVGDIRVLQLRRIIFEKGSPVKLSRCLSTKYANKTLVVSRIPKKFRKILES